MTDTASAPSTDPVEPLDALHAHFPDHRFERVGDLQQHHDAFRTDCVLRAPDGTAALTGTDDGVTSPSGRLSRVTGFFDPPADAAASNPAAAAEDR